MDIVRLVSQSKRREDKLAPGAYYPLWQFKFTEAGIALLLISADVSSSRPVKLAIYRRQDNAQWQEVWAAQPSTRIVDDAAALAAFGPHEMKIDDIVVLETPGSYELRIENPSSAHVFFTVSIEVFMYGGPAIKFWRRQYIKSAIKYATLDGVKTKTAPMGIASDGIMEVGGWYIAYISITNAVKGAVYISPNISASGYGPEGTHHGRTFSVQLNTFAVVGLEDGTEQYYWIQNAVVPDENRKGLKVENNIWNATTVPSTLDKSRVRGKGKIYNKPGRGDYYYYCMPDPDSTDLDPIPFGDVTLETWVRVDGGEIIIEFYVNGQKYDEVAITPRVPATSAHIVIAPFTTPTGHPLDLELVFGGRDDRIPLAVLERGQIGLELYVRMNGVWVPPPSAWSIGSIAANHVFGYSSASVEPQGVGSAIVKPGEPNLQQLWAGTIIATPLGINATNSTDLSPYAESLPEFVDFDNDTRLILVAYINGRPAQLSSLSNVPLGSIVVLQYERQYLVSISALGNRTAVWINAGASYTPPTISKNGIKLVPQESVIVDAPMNIDVRYNAYAEVPTTFAGLPALYAEASITCGGATNSTSGFFVSSLRLELIDAPSDKCSISAREVPLVIPIAILIVIALAIALIRRR